MPDNTVSNTPDAEYILVSKDNLLYFWLKLTLLFADKVDKEAGKGLSTEDFTTALKEKLVGLTEFSGDYADLTSKPSIAGVELVGAKTLAELGIQPAGTYPTTAEVQTMIAAVVNSAPAALDTLQELATALGNDPNFATTITTALGNKLDSSAIRELTNAEIDTILATTSSNA